MDFLTMLEMLTGSVEDVDPSDLAIWYDTINMKMERLESILGDVKTLLPLLEKSSRNHSELILDPEDEEKLRNLTMKVWEDNDE